MSANAGNISVFFILPLITRLMGSIIISKTEINCHRPSHSQCLPHQIINPLYQFRSSGKGVFSGNSHFHNQQITFTGNSLIHPIWCPPISCCNPQHGSSMSTVIWRWNKTSSLVFSKCKRLIDLLFRIFSSCHISLRRISLYALIP